MEHGEDRKSDKFQEINLSLEDAAKRLNISEPTVKHARVVLKSGCADLIRAVEQMVSSSKS